MMLTNRYGWEFYVQVLLSSFMLPGGIFVLLYIQRNLSSNLLVDTISLGAGSRHQ